MTAESGEGGPVHDPDKARRMAEAEAPKRAVLAEFKTFLDDPPAYRDSGTDESKELYDDFVEMAQMGVHSGDLKAMAEEVGDIEGFAYDIEQRSERWSLTQLRFIAIIIRYLVRLRRRKLEVAVARVPDKAGFFLTDQPNAVQEKLDRFKGFGDRDLKPCVEAFKDWHQTVKRLELYEKIIAAKRSTSS